MTLFMPYLYQRGSPAAVLLRLVSDLRSGDAAKPNTSTKIFEAQRHFPSESLGMENFQECGEEHDLEVVIELQKRPKKICLRPRSTLVNPLSRIFERVENIMEVNVNTCLQARQDLKQDHVYIASDLGDMCRIDK